jgi:hypothetical protein
MEFSFSLGFEVLTAVVMKVAFLCVTPPCSPYLNRCLGERYLISTLKMEVILCSERFIYIWATRRYNPEDGNFGKLI